MGIDEKKELEGERVERKGENVRSLFTKKKETTLR